MEVKPSLLALGFGPEALDSTFLPALRPPVQGVLDLYKDQPTKHSKRCRSDWGKMCCDLKCSCIVLVGIFGVLNGLTLCIKAYRAVTYLAPTPPIAIEEGYLLHAIANLEWRS